jgi:hypothetical protein
LSRDYASGIVSFREPKRSGTVPVRYAAVERWGASPNGGGKKEMIKRMLGPALIFALSGCGGSTQPLNVIDASMIGPVLSSIKREVGIY